MDRKRMIFIAIMLVLIFLALSFLPGKAGDGLPEGIAEWTRADGSICSANMVTGGIDCDCPCDQLCVEPSVITKETPTKPVPTPDPTTPPPTDEPTKTPEPEEEKKGNCGGGNGPEGNNPTTNCDEKKNDKQDEK